MATAYAYVPELPPPAPEIGDYRRACFTADEFLRMQELSAFEGHKVELVSGELWEEALHGSLHARLQARLTILLGSVSPEGLVAVDLSVRVSDATVRDIDAAILARDPGVVSAVQPSDVVLAVEIAVTTLSGDLNVKSREYARAGIANYWVVDAVGEAVHAMRAPGPDGYAERVRVPFDQPLSVPGGGTIVVAPGDA